MHLDDTIVAIATPAGRGGIGVVRLAGPAARSIAAPMLRLQHQLAPGRAIFAELIDSTRNPYHSDPANAVEEPLPRLDSRSQPAASVSQHESAARIDEVVVTYFAKPHSYTTDDIVEISAHGSPVVLRRIVEMALASGARLAEPGEFTQRAFLNGRLDLTQAEAVRDLIEAQTLHQAQVAAQQLGGALSRRLLPVKQQLVELIAILEAGVDFAEDDVSVLPDAAILARIAAVHVPLESLATSFAYGHLVHAGLTLAIVGRPNVGKSSLFNRLIDRDRAIVTSTPGTTRDLVTETISLSGIPLTLVDTAGIRESLDEAESIGIRKSQEALADADLILLVLDSSVGVTTEDEALITLVGAQPAIFVQNKSDLAATAPDFASFAPRATTATPTATAINTTPTEPVVAHSRLWPSAPEHTSRGGPLPQPLIVQTSAITGEGIAELRMAILQAMGAGPTSQSEAGFLTTARHQQMVKHSLDSLAKAADAVRSRTPHEMLLLDLYASLRPLDEITGTTTTDDILNQIFSTFCIGK